MLLFWRIRYLDRQDKEFKDRDLWLDTRTLDPVTRSAVELCNELRDTGNGREMLRYRHLFKVGTCNDYDFETLFEKCGRFAGFSLTDYFEDEYGEQLSNEQMGVTLTGNTTAIMLPPGSKQHDIDYILAEIHPVQFDRVALSSDQLNSLGYFSRDLRELIASTFYKNGPGDLVGSGNGDLQTQTAVNDEEIRSFVTIFRRLYMDKEPGNFLKSVGILNDCVAEYPQGIWAKGTAAVYDQELDQQPDFVPYIIHGDVNFTSKRLIDVFLYTRYAHQPDEKRSRQYEKCLESANGQAGLLFWLFLNAMWKCALHMRNAGTIVAEFYDSYCLHHGMSSTRLKSVYEEHPAMGILEKREARRERAYREKTEELAKDMWIHKGCPSGGPAQFFAEASKQLCAELNDDSCKNKKASNPD